MLIIPYPFFSYSKVEGLFRKKIPPKLKSKLESYYSYIIDNQSHFALSIGSLEGLFPDLVVSGTYI